MGRWVDGCFERAFMASVRLETWHMTGFPTDGVLRTGSLWGAGLSISYVAYTHCSILLLHLNVQYREACNRLRP